jgi:predicted transcriptional regulator
MSGITDAYEDYNIMCAMWLLSAACRKKVSLKLKQGVIYPNLYIMLFGLSTISRKSTSINKAKSFWELITEEKLFNDDYSLEGYLNLLQSKPISNFVRDEVVGLLQKYNKSYNDGIYELENSIYDCQSVRKTLASSSRKSKDDDKKDDDVVKDPYVTRLSGTTGHNYSSCMTVANFRTGYGFRHLYCHPQYKKDRMPLALEEIIDVKAHADVSKAYRHIYEIIGNIRKEIGVKVNPDAMEYLDKVDKEMQEKIIKFNEEDMASAWGRNVDHILKLCMLIEIGKAPHPNFTITLDTMKEACRIVKEYFFPTCIETLEQLQEDEQRNKVEKVVNVLRRKGGTCQHSMLLKSSKLLSDDFNRVISTLKESGVIEEYTGKKTGAKYYVLKKDSAIEKL